MIEQIALGMVQLSLASLLASLAVFVGFAVVQVMRGKW